MTRRTASWTFTALVVATLVLAVSGLVVGFWRPWAPALVAASTDLIEFSDEVGDAVQAYRAPRVIAAFLARLVAVLVPVLVAVTPTGRRVVDAVVKRSPGRRPIVVAAVLGAAVALMVWVASLPIAVWTGLVHDGTWGVRRASATLWWRDRILAGLLGFVLTAGIAAGFMALLRRRPHDWAWVGTWVLTATIGVLGVVWPLVVSPLFLPTRPLEPGPIREAVVEVLDRAQMSGARIEVAEASTRTTKINALVTGLGPTRRVLLHDTLLDRPIDEIEVVLAHELAHRGHRDIARGVLVSVPGILLGALGLRRVLRSSRLQQRVGADGAFDPRMVVVALAAIAVLQAVSDPAVLWYSRRVEAAADHAALVLSRDPAAVVGIQRAFVVNDLARPDPPRWQTVLLSTHPPPGARIRHAVAFARREGIDVPDRSAYEAAERGAGVAWVRP